MSGREKRHEGEQAAPGATAEPNPFEVPCAITKQIRKCAKAGSRNTEPDVLDYLWINVAEKPSSLSGEDRRLPELTLEDWLSIVDEAASLGARYLVMCAGDSFAKCPDAWAIVRWAQHAHGMTVGIHTRCRTFGDVELNEIKRLDGKNTWFFVCRENLEAMRYLEEHGVNICCAEVDHEPGTHPCDTPKHMVYVGPGGMMYACGLVLGKREFRMGHVFERRLSTVAEDDSLPRDAASCSTPHEHGCDACPDHMAWLMAGEEQDGS